MSIFGEYRVAFISCPHFDSVDFPYIVKFRPKISWFSEAIKKTRTLEKYLGEKLVLVEKTDLVQVPNLDRLLKEEYLKVHIDTLYLSLKNLPYFKPLLHINLTLASEALSLSEQGYIVVMPCIPPDHWAGRTFVRKCSIFALSVYLAKSCRADRPAIMGIDVHYGVGIQDHAEYDYEEAKSEELEELANESVEEKSAESGESSKIAGLVRPGRLFYLSVCSMSEVDTKLFRKAKKKPWCFLPVTVPPGVRDDVFLRILDTATRIITVYRPDVLIVQLGLDMYREDTIGEFMLSCDAYYDIGQLISSIPQNVELKKLFILVECVSARESVEKAFTNFIAGLLGVEKPYYDPVKKESTQAVKKLASESIRKLRRMLSRHWKIKVTSRI